jgi:2-methylfumaryl-CoA isomerase
MENSVTMDSGDGTLTTGTIGAPLSGLRILDLSTYVAGPSGMMTLAQLGAEVIRIDPIGGATDHRRLPLSPNKSSLYWAGLNKAKRSIEINIASDEGRELVGALLASSGPDGGILLTNSVAQPWLEYESMVQHRSDLIEVHITGRRDGQPAVDYTVNCEVGLPHITGPVDVARPVNHVLPAWDLLTGLHAAIAVLTAERVRRATGQGQKITVALADVAVATMSHLGFVADVAMNGQSRLRDGNYLYGSFGCDFATSDNERVMIVALTERHWHKLIEVTGISGAIAALETSLKVNLNIEEDRYRYREILEALIRPWFEDRTLDEVSRALNDANILWGPYRSLEGFVNDPSSLLHLTTLMSDVDQPGIGTFPVPGPVLEFSRWQPDPPAPAPRLGQDTDGVLASLLGLDDSEISDLRARSVIGSANS